jgi:transcriptional regulator with XRE-family HTH domain
MFATRLTYARSVLNGFTQAELALKVGISELQIWRYENENVQAKTETLRQLATALNVSSDFLLGLTDYPGPQIEGELTSEEKTVVEAMRHGDKLGAVKAIVGG